MAATPITGLARRLAIPSPAVRARVEAGGAGGALPPGTPFAVDDAEHWFAFLLKPVVALPARLAVVPIPQEEGVCDTVRATYRARAGHFWIAQCRYLFAVTLEPAGRAPPTDAAGAAALAAQIFETERPISFAPPAGPPAGFPSWEPTLRWETMGPRIAFTGMKLDGSASREAISGSVEDNARWF